MTCPHKTSCKSDPTMTGFMQMGHVCFEMWKTTKILPILSQGHSGCSMYSMESDADIKFVSILTNICKTFKDFSYVALWLNIVCRHL